MSTAPRALFLLAAAWLGGLIFSPPAAAQRAADPDGTPQWEILNNCRLLKNRAFDGDSFHLRQGKREYIVRLYGVDAPETDAEFADRVDEQSRHFGVSEDHLLEIAAAARQHVQDALKDKFTVITRWENALGRSALARFYGIVLVGETNLALDLVRQGLARPHGVIPPWPDAAQGKKFQAELRQAEQEARRLGRGAWNRQRYPAAAPARKSQPGPTTQLDLNTASLTELVALPGIGPALAERIRARRPYRRVEDLQDVPGIGPKTLEALRGRVTVGAPASAPRKP